MARREIVSSRRSIFGERCRIIRNRVKDRARAQSLGPENSALHASHTEALRERDRREAALVLQLQEQRSRFDYLLLRWRAHDLPMCCSARDPCAEAEHLPCMAGPARGGKEAAMLWKGLSPLAGARASRARRT